MGLAFVHPADAIFAPALHFHDMGNGVMSPTVARVERKGLASAILGPCIVAAFLQTEGMHAQQDMVARIRRHPDRQTPCDAVAQAAGVTEKKVEEVCCLQGQHIVRPEDEDILKTFDRLAERTAKESIDGKAVHTCALVARRFVQRLARRTHIVETACVGAGDEEIGAKDMRHCKVG